MSGYQKHVFVCENNRTDGRCCCNNGNSNIKNGAVKYMRNLLKAGGYHGKGQVRVNRAGCFDRCQEGPVLVVYPQGRWYRYDGEADLQEIIETDILGDRVVTRLAI